jgi:hypothetical protein
MGICCVVVWVLLAFPTVAEAHAIGAEAKLRDGRVNVEAFYDDNTAADSAKVVVTDSDGKVVAEGKTDKDGKWSFEAPAPGKYKVAVNAGAGHRTTVSLTIPATPGKPADSQAAVPSNAESEEVTVTDGPSRSEFTGWRRTALAALGVVLIGGGTWVSMRIARAVNRRQERSLMSSTFPDSCDPRKGETR